MEKDYEKARKYLFNLLNFRDYTLYELEKKLVNKGYDGKTVKSLLKFVKESGFINSKEQINRLIEKNTRSSPKGRYIIRKKLEAKGFKKEEYGKALESLDEEPLARAALEKRMKKSFGNKEKNRIKGYLFKFLATKGFGYDTIEKVLKEAKLAEIDDNADDRQE